jgi:hypothetical protein
VYGGGHHLDPCWLFPDHDCGILGCVFKVVHLCIAGRTVEVASLVVIVQVNGIGEQLNGLLKLARLGKRMMCWWWWLVVVVVVVVVGVLL